MTKLTEQAREFFKADLYATEATGIEIEEAAKGYARVKLGVEAKHKNAAGSVMGAVYFTMADFAFAVASNTEQDLTVTTDSEIHFLAPAKGDTLYAEAKNIKEGKGCLYEIRVTDSEGTLVAFVTASGRRISKP